MKPIWKILIVVAVVVAFLLVIFSHSGSKAALDAYRAQLKRQGEKMTIDELTPQVSADAEKNGRELLAGAKSLPFPKELPHSMYLIAPGRALVGWSEAISPTYDSTNCWPVVSEAIKKNQNALVTVQNALAKPNIGFRNDYHQGYPSFTYLSSVKKISLYLSAAGSVALHEGDSAKSWSNLLAGSELVQKVGDDPMIINQLVRIAMINIQSAQTWEALRYSGWSDAQLAQLQQNWDSFNLLDPAESALSMERALGPGEVDKMRSSYKNFAGATTLSAALSSGTNLPAFDNIDNFHDVALHPFDAVKSYFRFRSWKSSGSYEEELCIAQIWQAALETIRHARTNNGGATAQRDFDLATTNILNSWPGWENRFVLTDETASSTSMFLSKVMETEMTRRMVVTAIALERYRLRHGKYPEQLTDLTPELLSKLPIDFMDGKPLRYRRRDDGTFLLYSVGEDGRDDGGDASSQPGSKLRGKAWYKMRDAVWPMPAAPDEVKKYEAQMLEDLAKNSSRKPGPAGTNSTAN